jgi:TetR/AcrR family transcriptional regulator, regulator of cefoperazone and chloramphenicol sensitivity
VFEFVYREKDIYMKKNRETILIATIACIEKNGIQTVTVRDIAGEANVNVAAINYHFGSKDNLLAETLKLTLQNALVDWKEILEREYESPSQLFMELFSYSLEGIFRYPNITRAHLHDPLIEGNYRGYFVTKFDTFLNSLADKVESIGSGKSREEIELSIVQMFSSVFSAGLAPGMYRRLKHFDVSTSTGRKKFVEHLVSAYWR